MKRFMAILLAVVMLLGVMAGCSNGDKNNGGTERKEISMWFWGTNDYQREAMSKYLIDAFNNSQDEYTLTVEYRSSVDNDIAVALSGGEGPDIIYGSGPAFVSGYAAEGLLVNLDTYAEQYGWKDRLVPCFYDMGTVGDSLYSIPGGLSSYGVFYNKAVLEENGWDVPTTYEELTATMDKAIEAGMYGGLIGAKDWRYTNGWIVGILMTDVAGPEALYKCLTGEQKWNSPKMVEAVEEMNTWYQNGYMGGQDYWNLDANEIFVNLMEGKTPFCFAPLNGFQWAKGVAPSEEALDNLGFIPIPGKDGEESTVTIGSVCTFSINANCENPDGAAAVLNYMLTGEFATGMSTDWPGYWGIPVIDFTKVDVNDYEGVSRQYVEACVNVVEALNNGRFGYSASSSFPTSVYEACIDIDTVWFGEKTVEEYLDALDAAYARDTESGALLTLPKPTF